MEIRESFNKLKEILIGDFQDLERLGITIFFSLLLLIFFIIFSRWIKKLIGRKLLKRLDDTLLVNFISVVIRGLILIFGIVLILRFLGLTGIVGGVLAGAGITAFIIGFALKDIGENFLAGILLAFKRPFKVGDIVEINGFRGRIVALNLRDTQIKSMDGKDIFMPNASIIKNPLTNFTIDGYLSYNFVVGLDYGSNYGQAVALIGDSIKKVPGVLLENKKPTVYVSELSPSTLNITVTFWVDTYNRIYPDIQIRSNAILTVLTDLENAGFNLPGDIVELKNYRNLLLKQDRNK